MTVWRDGNWLRFPHTPPQYWETLCRVGVVSVIRGGPWCSCGRWCGPMKPVGHVYFVSPCSALLVVLLVSTFERIVSICRSSWFFFRVLLHCFVPGGPHSDFLVCWLLSGFGFGCLLFRCRRYPYLVPLCSCRSDCGSPDLGNKPVSRVTSPTLHLQAGVTWFP